MTNPKEPSVQFEGEEAGSGFASPLLDLIATAILVAISIAVMVASVRLPVPGDIQTAPGLLPFIVSATLLLMSLGLGASAVARWRSGVRLSGPAERDYGTDQRSMLLAGAIALYIATLQVLAFQHNISILGVNLRLSAFEPATIVALTTIMFMSWRGPIWIMTVTSVSWTLVLSLVFQLVFRIPLPGSF